MPKNLVKIESDGSTTVIQAGVDINSANLVNYGSNYFIVDSGITSPSDSITTYTSFNPLSLASVDSLYPPSTGTIGGLPSSFLSATAGSSALTDSVPVFSLAEQKIEGTGYGTFIPTELVFQSTITPQVINYLTLSGATATEYNPTIGTIGATGTNGFVGSRAAQFKGSYLDTDTAAAGISLPGFTTASYFLISGWVYMETAPTSAYDPILITRSPDGVTGTTSDSFRLEYDYSSSRFQFHFSTTANTTTTGFDHTMNVSPSGVTLNEWNHFAVAYSKPTAGNTAYVSSYWNGNQIQYYTGATGSLRGTKSSLYIGCGGNGKKPFKGWLDDLVVSAGTTSDALRGFLHGTTATVPSTHQDAGYYTVYYLSMDGPIGTSYFPCDTTNKMASNVAFQGSSLYVYGCMGVTASRMWTDTLNGVCGGHAAAGASAGYIFGYDSGACWIPTSVTEISSGLTAAKQYRKDLNEYTFRYYLGLTMYGASGASGDFKKLYSGSTFPTSFTYTPLESNVNYLKNIYDSIIVAGSTLSVSIADSYGVYYTFATAAAVNLYQDVLLYYNTANSGFSNISNTIDGQSTFSSLKRITGVSGPVIVSKLAASGNESLFISPLSTVTKTSRSPENYWNISVEQQVLTFVD
jgi:hypothetical protein